MPDPKIKKFKKVLQMDPNDETLWFGLGRDEACRGGLFFDVIVTETPTRPFLEGRGLPETCGSIHEYDVHPERAP